jgi:hypothetical protein
MTITLPKSFIIFAAHMRRGSEYQPDKPPRLTGAAGNNKGQYYYYHLAIKFQKVGRGATSICGKTTVDSISGYWWLISWEELTKYDEELTP